MPIPYLQYEADATKLQEMRCAETGFLQKSDYTVYYSGRPIGYVIEIDFAESEKLKPPVIDFEFVSEDYKLSAFVANSGKSAA